MVLKHLMGNDLLSKQRPGGEDGKPKGPVVVVLSARVGSIGDNRLGGYVCSARRSAPPSH